MRKSGAEEPLEGERNHGGARPPTSPLGKSSPPKLPRRNAISQVFAQDLIVFCPQVGGGAGVGSLCCQVSGWGEETYGEDIWEGS